MTEEFTEWTPADTKPWIAVPEPGADKYSRGVLGVITGSAQYPGAAVLGVEGAVRTGVGMLRYLGPDNATSLVLQRRPEIVTGAGRVQAWLAGSGMSADARSEETARQLSKALAEGVPVVLDAGALDLVRDATGLLVITPHFGELATLFTGFGQHVEKAQIAADPKKYVSLAAKLTGATVLLKGNTTYVADASGQRISVTAGPPWLATAGSGDVLGGVLGALVATHSSQLESDPGVLAKLAASAARLHGAAGFRASDGAPIAALDIAEALPATIRALLAD